MLNIGVGMHADPFGNGTVITDQSIAPALHFVQPLGVDRFTGGKIFNRLA